MKTSGFKRKVLLLACSNTLLQLMGFVYRMALTRLAGARALGLNSLVMQVYSIVVSVCISGLSVAATNLAAEAKGGARLKRLLSKCIVLYCGLWLLAAAPIFILRHGVASRALGDAAAAKTLALMLVCIFMTGLENVLKAVHMGAGLVSRCAASELCEQAVRFLLVILMLLRLPHETDAQTVFYIMLGMTASELVSVGFLSCSFSRATRGEDIHSAPPCSFAPILRIAAPATATAMASTVFASCASLLLPFCLQSGGMSRADALSLIGVLTSVAVPIVFFPMAACAALASVLMPRIACLSANDVHAAAQSAGRAVRFSAVFGICASLLTALSAPAIARGLFGTEASPWLFAAVSLKAAAIYPQTVATAVLNGAKKQRAVLVFAVAGEAYQLIMMLLLTPVWGVYGWAAAGAAGETLRLCCSLTAVGALYPKRQKNARPALTQRPLCAIM